MTEAIPKLFDVNEAAQFLRYKPAYIYQLVHNGQITGYKPNGKNLLFKLSDLEAYAFRNQKTADFQLAEKANQILTA